MKGIDFVVDEAGDRKAVVIDLSAHGEVWEDVYDHILAREREQEPRLSLAEVKQQLGLDVG